MKLIIPLYFLLAIPILLHGQLSISPNILSDNSGFNWHANRFYLTHKEIDNGGINLIYKFQLTINNPGRAIINMENLRLVSNIEPSKNGQLSLTGGSDHSSGLGFNNMIQFNNLAKFQHWDIGIWHSQQSSGAGDNEGTIIGFRYQGTTVAAVQTNGNWFQISDKRFKNNIQAIKTVSRNVQQLKLSKYELKQTKGQTEFGFIAQELKEQFPALVLPIKNGEETSYLVNYTGMIPILIKAIQEQEQSMGQKRMRIEDNQHQISKLKWEIMELANLLGSFQK